MHIVTARQKDGRLVKVAGTMAEDWHLVLDRWTRLDRANRNASLYVEDDRKDGWLYIKPAAISHLMVRELGDPAIAKTDTVALFITRGTGAKNRGSVAARWGKAHGYHGHVGGWIYRNPHHANEVALRQGWHGLVPRRAIAATLVPGNVRYHLIEEL